MKKEVCDLIVAAGIPINSKGYWYIREAVLLAVEDRDNLMYVTKDLYPEIARRYKTSPTGVEKAMRDAVSKSWEKGNIPEGFRALCNRKPTNSQFVTYVYELLSARYRLE
ncbi:MAG: sporulation initiation factor Spo0A C-terminal domain-containing protein [Lachnospiraceae bacterium]|nr:sporulation initiation factor Spo0A C-terminal domain-containing protein [Lachnospiraceae bacterium]